jgi:hypothetical protein
VCLSDQKTSPAPHYNSLVEQFEDGQELILVEKVPVVIVKLRDSSISPEMETICLEESLSLLEIKID